VTANHVVLRPTTHPAPPSPAAPIRIEALEKLQEIVSRDNFKSIESMVITELLPIVLARLDDKPKVTEAAEAVATTIVTKAAIQGFL
jgi:hypothetical protein